LKNLASARQREWCTNMGRKRKSQARRGERRLSWATNVAEKPGRKEKKTLRWLVKTEKAPIYIYRANATIVITKEGASIQEEG